MSDGSSFEERKYADEVAKRAAEREHDRLIEHGNRLNESATRDAQGAIRILLAINGGAAVAILAKIDRSAFAVTAPIVGATKLHHHCDGLNAVLFAPSEQDLFHCTVFEFIQFVSECRAHAAMP